MPTFTVVIPTHERPRLLDAALASVAEQSHPPMEVLVVDDSDDGATAAVVAQWQQHGLPVARLLQRDRPGPSASRNVGGFAARAAFVAFLDDDDSWASNHLSALAAALGEPAQAELVVSGRQRTGGRDGAATFEPGMPARAFLMNHYNVTGSNLAVERTRFAQLGGFDPDLYGSNDKDFMYRALAAGTPCRSTGQVTVRASRHEGGQLTDAYNSRQAEAQRQFYRKHRAAMTWWMRKRWLAHLALADRLAHGRSDPGTRLRLALAALVDKRVRRKLRRAQRGLSA